MTNETILRNQLQTAVSLLSAIRDTLDDAGEITSPELISKMLEIAIDQSNLILEATDSESELNS